MSSARIARFLLAAALGGSLAACGGGTDTADIGGSGGGPGGGPVAGIGGTGGGPQITSVGSITGFGSVFVNGIEFFFDDDSLFEIDGEAGDEAALAIGMVVRISGELDLDPDTQTVVETSGKVTSIFYDDDVEGPISNSQAFTASSASRQFEVFGIAVRVQRGVTEFYDRSSGSRVRDPGLFDSLADGDVVEISGFDDGSGTLVANLVEKKAAAPVGSFPEVELKGVIGSLAMAGACAPGNSFVLRGITVLTDSATDCEDLPAGGLVEGLNVEVEGRFDAVNNRIEATEVEAEDDGGFPNTSGDAKVNIEGLVNGLTGDAASGSFRVNGQLVNYSSTTAFEPASLRASLANGLKVQAEGPVSGGAIQAAKIEARGGRIKIAATVLSAPLNNRLNLGLLGASIPVQIDSRTVMRDSTDATPELAPGEILVGNFLSVEAFDNGEDVLLATRIEREEPEDRVLQAPLVAAQTSFDAGSGSGVLTLQVLSGANPLSIAVAVSDTTGYFRLDESPYGSAQDFFDDIGTGIADGALVKVQLEAGDDVADEAEIED